MEFKKIAELIFESIPEFELFYKEDLDEKYYNFFLGDFGIFSRDAVINNSYYAPRCLMLINEIINQNFENEEFRNKMIINILEVLTDYRITQEMSIKYFNGNCFETFREILDSGFFNNLIE